VKRLVNANADLDAEDNRKTTPMMAAFRRGFTEIVEYLVTKVTQFPSDGDCLRYQQSLVAKVYFSCDYLL
jgi:ankyrin repeat domain-containing protein 17